LNKRERGQLALTILLAVAAGGLIGAGVGLNWYGPLLGTSLAILIGLATGARVFRAVRKGRRGVKSSDSTA
jgi:hypothetical protein